MVIINTLKENLLDMQYERGNTNTLESSETSSPLGITVETLFLQGLKDSQLQRTISIIAGIGEATSRPDKLAYRSYALVRDRNAIAIASAVLEGLEASSIIIICSTNGLIIRCRVMAYGHR